MSKIKNSRQWWDRQAKDPYVIRAKKEGYRGRAVYKLIEIQNKTKLFRSNMTVIDLGCAPGSWSQQIRQYIHPDGHLIGCDCLAMSPLAGCTFLQGDFTQSEVVAAILAAANGPIDCVVSDMAPNFSGHRQTDQLKAMGLVESAYAFAFEHLKVGGHFVVKIFMGAGVEALIHQARQDFITVKTFKPKASRAESNELYLLALHRRGAR